MIDLHCSRAAFGLALVCLLSVTDGRAQQPAASDRFAPVAFMIGRWQGSSQGQPGNANVRREYSRAPNGRFVRVRNRSEYPVQDKNRKARFTKTKGLLAICIPTLRSILCRDASGSHSSRLEVVATAT